MNKKNIFIGVFAFGLLASGAFFIWKYFRIEGKKEINLKSSNNMAVEEENKDVSENLLTSEENMKNEMEEINAKDVNTNVDIEKDDIEKENEKHSSLKIIDRLVNWGHQKSSGRLIDTIIIHSSYNALGGDEYSTEKLLEEYKNYGVSSHYLIDRKGSVFRLVEDKNIAYHAGKSKTPDGRTGVNNFSLGIEVMNTKEDSFTSAQYSSLKHILAYIKEKYSIKYVLGHSDVSKGRKDDPWNFNWNKIK